MLYPSDPRNESNVSLLSADGAKYPGVFTGTRKGSGESVSCDEDEDLDIRDMVNGTTDIDIVAEIDNGPYCHLEGKDMMRASAYQYPNQLGYVTPQHPDDHDLEIPPLPPSRQRTNGYLHDGVKSDEFIVKGSIDNSHQNNNFEVVTPGDDSGALNEVDEEIGGDEHDDDDDGDDNDNDNDNDDDDDDDDLWGEMALTDSEQNVRKVSESLYLSTKGFIGGFIE